MVYEVLLITVITALIQKGSFRQLQETKIAFSVLIIICFLIQVSVMILYDRVKWIQLTFPMWIILSYLVLAYCSWQNRQLPGFKLFGAGMVLNFLVIALNDGRMPVSIDALEWAGLSSYIQPLVEGITKHQPITQTTYLPFLADVIPLRPPFAFSGSVVSGGDIVMTLGISRFFYKRMVG